MLVTSSHNVALSDCRTLDTTWTGVTTEPALPVSHETSLTLSCLVGQTNTGGDTATCQDGLVVMTTNPPHCQDTGECTVFSK